MDICGHCTSKVESSGVMCDCCKFWVHFQCEGRSRAEGELWVKMGKRAKFYCTVRNCEQIADQFINSIGPLKDQVDSNTKRIELLEQKFNVQENSIRRDTEKEVNRAIFDANKALEETSKLSSKVEEVEATIRSQTTTVTSNVGNPDKDKVIAEVKAALVTEKDREFRARNLILAKAPEPDTDDLDTGKASDLNFVTKLFSQDMGLDMQEIKIIDTTRLHDSKNSNGKQRNYQEQPRLLRVRFEREEMVGVVAKASPRLQLANNPTAKGVRIFRDKTKTEREERRQLIDLAVKKNEEEQESDMFKWIVDYNKKNVIRISRGNSRQTTFRQRRYR